MENTFKRKGRLYKEIYIKKSTYHKKESKLEATYEEETSGMDRY